MTNAIEYEPVRDQGLIKMVDGLVSRTASIAASMLVLQQTMVERTVSLQRTAPPDLFDLGEIAGAMEKVLLLWSCDSERPCDRGLDLRERATLVEMAVAALAAMRRP